MIRSILRSFPIVFVVVLFGPAGLPSPTSARTLSAADSAVVSAPATAAFPIGMVTAAAPTRFALNDPPARKPGEHAGKGGAAKPFLVGTYGDWGAYAAKVGTHKECYALAQPKDREPSNLKRDPAYIFIADRPAENVRDELSIMMGFDVKNGDSDKKGSGTASGEVAGPTAEVGSQKFALVAKRGDLWLENIAKQAAMIAAMRQGNKLIVQATSTLDHLTTDEYSLMGFSQALDRVKKECQ